jgi:hypothetical protein
VIGQHGVAECDPGGGQQGCSSGAHPISVRLAVAGGCR